MPLLPITATTGDVVAGERVEVHPREAEGAVAEQQHDLALGVGELGRECVAGAGPEASVRPGIKPAAGLVRVDHAAGVGDEVAAVADHDRIAVEQLRQLAVDPHRVKRRSRIGELGRLAGALLGLDRPQRGDPAAPRSPTDAAGRGPPERAQRRRQRPVQLGRARAADARAGARRRRSRRSRRRRRTTPPNPSRKSSGTPITSATSACPSAAPRAREKNSSWSAGTQPRPSPLRNTGIRSCSASARSCSSPRPQYRPVPAMIAGRSASRSSAAARSSSRGSPLSPVAHGCGIGSGAGLGL